jgi:basic membrane protein A
VPTAGPANLAIITFREGDAGYLAGALAGRITKTGIVAGVYGLEDDHDAAYRLGFERGAHAVSASMRVLGVYQGAQDGAPYNNPAWGAAQARAFIDQGADVIFSSGDLTGHGALTAAAAAGEPCITIGYSVEPAAPVCLLATVVLRVDRAVAAITMDAVAARWQGGERRYGQSDGYIELRSLD